jgi:hypothetical protein
MLLLSNGETLWRKLRFRNIPADRAEFSVLTPAWCWSALGKMNPSCMPVPKLFSVFLNIPAPELSEHVEMMLLE